MPYLPPQFNVEVQRPGLIPGAARPLTSKGDWSAAPPPEPPSQLLEYWQVMRANLGWICLMAALGAGAGWLVAAMKPAMYEAKTVLDIRSLNEDFLNPRDGSPVSNSGSVLPESYIQTEIKILSSDSLRKRALGRLEGLKNPPKTAAETPPSFWHTLFGQFEKKPVPLLDLAVDAARRVKVRAVGNTRIVEVLCDAKDAELAANICNNLADTYIAYNLESRYKSTRETGDWLQSQLEDVKKRLTKSENELKDASRDGSGALQFDSTSNDNPARDKLRQIEADLSRAETERINRESDYAIASTRPAESMPMAFDAGPIREYRMRLSDLRRQLAEKSATQQPGHYEIRQLNQQIAEVQSSLNQERDDLIRRLKADLDTAQRRETVLRNEYEKQATQVLMLGDKAIRSNMLQRDVASDQKLYENLLQRVDEVGLAAAMRTSTISVVDPAVAPGSPYSPNVLFSVGIGLFGGSLLGLCFSFIHVRSDRTLRGPGEASMHLQLRELGVIPSIRNRRLDTLVGRMRTMSNKGALPGPGLQEEASAESTSLALPRSFPSSLALATWLRIPEITEAIFGTMSSLRFATERGERAGVIVVTSPEPGEGKTTVATNLAIALAQIGRRVIIVDGDLRKPRLDRIFDMVCEGGLAGLLEKQEAVEQLVLTDFVRKTAIPNLTVLATKAANEGICTKLHSSRMRILIERLRQEYDSVVIDSPPMLQIADARVLGWLADGVLLVLRARRTTRDSAIAAYHCLLQDGINVLGTVLNDWNPGRGETYGAYKSYIRVN
jgi:capsular exopolysaccharide synthesis family protein